MQGRPLASLRRLKLRHITLVSCVAFAALGAVAPPVTAVPPAQPVWFPPADISVSAASLTKASDYEKEILRDGSVSFEEYKGSLGMLEGCLRDAGYATTEMIEGPEPGFLHFNSEPPSSESATFAGYFQCESQYASVVPAVYFIQQIPTGDQLDRRIRDLARCLGPTEVPAELTTSAAGLRRAFVEPEELSDMALGCFARYETVLHAIDPDPDREGE